jgi:hypothetical protein
VAGSTPKQKGIDMTNTTYEGWTNRATWNVNLWIDNEYPLYCEKMRFLRSSAMIAPNVAELSHRVRTFCEELFEGGKTPDMKTRADMAGVNWIEIAEAWIEDAKEAERYPV